MAIPVADHYASSSAQPIYAGHHDRPGWRLAMKAHTWAAVPTTNTLNDLDPRFNALINPNYPGNPAWYGNGFANIVTGWSGVTWDEANRRMLIALAGGHGDYGGNEPYRLILGNEAPAFEMLAYPSGAAGDGVVILDGNESSGVYADGKPRPVHTYNHQVYVPNVGPVMTRLTGSFPGVGMLRKAYAVNPDTGLYSLFSDWTSITTEAGGLGAAAYDVSRNCIWMLGTDAARLMKMDVATGVVTRHGTYANHVGAYVKMVYVPEHDVLLTISSSTSGYIDSATRFSVWNLVDFTQTAKSCSGSFAPGFAMGGQTGADWYDGRLLLWDNTSNTAQISTLTPMGDLINGPWVAGALTVASANAVVPTARNINGTYNRFWCSASMRCAFLYNGVTQAVYCYALD